MVNNVLNKKYNIIEIIYILLGTITFLVNEKIDYIGNILSIYTNENFIYMFFLPAILLSVRKIFSFLEENKINIINFKNRKEYSKNLIKTILINESLVFFLFFLISLIVINLIENTGIIFNSLIILLNVVLKLFIYSQIITLIFTDLYYIFLEKYISILLIFAVLFLGYLLNILTILNIFYLLIIYIICIFSTYIFFENKDY